MLRCIRDRPASVPALRRSLTKHAPNPVMSRDTGQLPLPARCGSEIHMLNRAYHIEAGSFFDVFSYLSLLRR